MPIALAQPRHILFEVPVPSQDGDQLCICMLGVKSHVFVCSGVDFASFFY